MTRVAMIVLAAACCAAQNSSLTILNHGRPVLDAHNCYPYETRWSDRIDRALSTGFPVAIEQDLAWYVDPSTGRGRVVVSHKPETNGSEPALRDYFFERVRPIIEKALASSDHSGWPLIVLHFDFKDNQKPLLHAVWDLLGEREGWITTAVKTRDPHQLAPLAVGPLLVLTEDNDAQEEVFFKELPVGGKLRLFGSAHTNMPASKTREESIHLAATRAPDELLSNAPTDYRRWWNNSWYEVEEGGQRRAGKWTSEDDRRLRALVNHAHKLGYWIRFYTLDGFAPGENRGWGEDYNFGSRAAVEERWNACLRAGVDLIATDQYEDLGRKMSALSSSGK